MSPRNISPRPSSPPPFGGGRDASLTANAAGKGVPAVAANDQELGGAAFASTDVFETGDFVDAGTRLPESSVLCDGGGAPCASLPVTVSHGNVRVEHPSLGGSTLSPAASAAFNPNRWH